MDHIPSTHLRVYNRILVDRGAVGDMVVTHIGPFDPRRVEGKNIDFLANLRTDVETCVSDFVQREEAAGRPFKKTK